MVVICHGAPEMARFSSFPCARRRTNRVAPIGAGLILLLAGAAAAHAEDPKPIEYSFPDGTVVRLSGQVNMGYLGYDDGQQSYGNFVDNDNSSTRARIQLFSSPNFDWRFEAIFEVEYQPLASNVVSQLDDRPEWSFDQGDIRKAEAAISNKSYGKLWLGQGSMASDGTAEVDKSGTTVIAYASVSDTAGGYFFRAPGGALSDVTVGDAFNDYDGLSRKFRIRYDTPTFGGFGVQVSYGYDWLVSDPKPMYDGRERGRAVAQRPERIDPLRRFVLGAAQAERHQHHGRRRRAGRRRTHRLLRLCQARLRARLLRRRQHRLLDRLLPRQRYRQCQLGQQLDRHRGGAERRRRQSQALAAVADLFL
ncbi:MAG: porin [Rhizobiales bacterium]|nr:porin [Hyphomicrobiales bacterium]